MAFLSILGFAVSVMTYLGGAMGVAGRHVL
jgi:hypothetical protein